MIHTWPAYNKDGNRPKRDPTACNLKFRDKEPPMQYKHMEEAMFTIKMINKVPDP